MPTQGHILPGAPNEILDAACHRAAVPRGLCEPRLLAKALGFHPLALSMDAAATADGLTTLDVVAYCAEATDEELDRNVSRALARGLLLRRGSTFDGKDVRDLARRILSRLSAG